MLYRYVVKKKKLTNVLSSQHYHIIDTHNRWCDPPTGLMLLIAFISALISASSLLSSCPIVHSHRFLVFCGATNTSKWQMMGPKGQHNKTTGVIVALWTVMGYNSRYRIISVLSVQNTKLLIQSELSLTMIHRIYQIWHILQNFPQVQQISPPKFSAKKFHQFFLFHNDEFAQFLFCQTGAKKNDLITFVLDVLKMLPGISSPPTV